MGATAPLPLEEKTVHRRLGASEMRLVRENIAQHTDPAQRLWLYQARESKDREWATQYSFTETEFLPEDYEIMSFWTSTHRTSIFTKAVLVAKYVMERGVLVGVCTMFNGEVKRVVVGEEEEEEERRSCGGEEER
ncbi:MAG: hypothetical protein Q9169_006959, partial [Polycauliona sp. 2 TL-2023]